MDINSHIDWHAGMPLKSATFKGLYRNIDLRERLLLKLYTEGTLMGVLPDTELATQGVFVRNAYEIERLKLTALLPDGTIIDADEAAQVNVPMLSGDTYYLCIYVSDENVTFESDDVKYVRPKYAYALLPLAEIKQRQAFPFAKFNIDNGALRIDNSYLLPYLLIGSSDMLIDYQRVISEKLYTLSKHPHLVDPDGRRTIVQLLFDLKTLAADTKTHDFCYRLQEIMLAIDYFVLRPNNVDLPLQDPEPYDLLPYLEWTLQFLDKAYSTLDAMVIEDNSIDYEQLKAEIKNEIYERVNPELYERLINDLKTNLRDELTETLSVTLTDYFETVIQPHLASTISAEVSQQLQSQLYDSLYNALYNALYVPPEEEAGFMPLI